jgi:hypothetical protein
MRINAAVEPKNCVLHFCTRNIAIDPCSMLRIETIWGGSGSDFVFWFQSRFWRGSSFFINKSWHTRHRKAYYVQVQVKPTSLLFSTFWTFERWRYFKNLWFKAVRWGSGSGLKMPIRVLQACLSPVLRIRIRDLVPFWPLDPGSGMGKKSYFRELS